MRRFDFIKAAGPDQAAQFIVENPEAKVVAGGTDLLPLMKDDLLAPSCLVDLSAWKDGRRIEATGDGGLRIGALCTLAAIASDETVRGQYGALADACELAAAPQLRNMGTIGGNLLQQTRCWYFRGPFDCWLKGGDKCFARDGENEQHAIFHTDPAESRCVSAHPSDPAAALLALNAEVEYVTHAGLAKMGVDELYRLPSDDNRQFTTLPADAIVTAIVLPDQDSNWRSMYHKAMPRAAWAFALAGVAAALDVKDGSITECRLALSGVAPIPIRASSVEQYLAGRDIATVDMARAAELLTADTRPLSLTGYKVDLLKGIFRQTFEELIAQFGVRR